MVISSAKLQNIVKNRYKKSIHRFQIKLPLHYHGATAATEIWVSCFARTSLSKILKFCTANQVRCKSVPVFSKCLILVGSSLTLSFFYDSSYHLNFPLHNNPTTFYQERDYSRFSAFLVWRMVLLLFNSEFLKC